MMYNFGINPLDEWINLEYITSQPIRINPYLVEILTKEFVLKKAYSFGAPDCVIKKIKYEESEKGSLNATIEVEYFDILIEYGDFVIIYYNGKRDYIGYVTEVPDTKGGTIKVDSLLNMAQRVVYRGGFVAKTKKEILETIVSSLFPISKINWNSSLVNFQSTEVFSPEYASIQLDTILDEWGKSEEDSFWRVNEEGFFEVKFRDSSISKTLYPGNYSGYKYKKDWKKIKFTVIDLWRNVEVNDVKKEVYVGQIPDGSSSFPYFVETENVIGRIIKKELAPDELTVNEAKIWAYGEVQAQIKPVEKLDIDGLKRNIEIKPGNLVRIYLPQGYDFKELVNTENLANWSGNVSLSSDSYDGDYSILINGTGIYTFSFIKVFADVKKIVFFVKSQNYGRIGDIKIDNEMFVLINNDGDIIVSNNYDFIILKTEYISIGDVFINIPNTWNYIDIKINKKEIREIVFELNNAKVDFVNFFAIFSRYYDLHCVNRSVNIDNNSFEEYDVEFGSYDRTSNDIQFEMAKTIERRSK